MARGTAGDRSGSGSREAARRIGELEVHQDLRFEKLNWRVQRTGWAVMTLFVLAALGGAFGRGPLSSATATSPRGLLRVAYDRVVRHGATSQLDLTISPTVIGDDGMVRVGLSRRFVQAQLVEDIQPEPESVVASGDSFIYAFDAAPGSPVHLVFRLVPSAYSLGPAEASLAGAGEAVTFRQLVLP